MICARSRPETKMCQMKIVSKETQIDKAKNVWKNLCCGARLYLGRANRRRTTFAVLVRLWKHTDYRDHHWQSTLRPCWWRFVWFGFDKECQTCLVVFIEVAGGTIWIFKKQPLAATCQSIFYSPNYSSNPVQLVVTFSIRTFNISASSVSPHNWKKRVPPFSRSAICRATRREKPLEQKTTHNQHRSRGVCFDIIDMMLLRFCWFGSSGRALIHGTEDWGSELVNYWMKHCSVWLWVAGGGTGAWPFLSLPKSPFRGSHVPGPGTFTRTPNGRRCLQLGVPRCSLQVVTIWKTTSCQVVTIGPGYCQAMEKGKIKRWSKNQIRNPIERYWNQTQKSTWSWTYDHLWHHLWDHLWPWSPMVVHGLDSRFVTGNFISVWVHSAASWYLKHWSGQCGNVDASESLGLHGCPHLFQTSFVWGPCRRVILTWRSTKSNSKQLEAQRRQSTFGFSFVNINLKHWFRIWKKVSDVEMHNFRVRPCCIPMAPCLQTGWPHRCQASSYLPLAHDP